MRAIFAWIVLLSLTACAGQQKEQQEGKKAAKTEIDTPKGAWEVKKEYDEYGNLIRYDSIYTWSYSNIQGDSVLVNLDSIMDRFRAHFEADSPFLWRDRFSYFPKADSLFVKEFFDEDYFFRNWEQQQQDMRELMRKMDSSRNAFLKRFHPGLMESGSQ
ncbi:MAG: hypothetical protein KJN96_05265 [Eudoraea sp.]|nr:hypothetical protein [Eudoraea sp.]MBT8222560.1 hypothetical protein [Eudoraea sp.]NNJ40986.1 hypothetical protein [Eudoraea sp.]